MSGLHISVLTLKTLISCSVCVCVCLLMNAIDFLMHVSLETHKGWFILDAFAWVRAARQIWCHRVVGGSSLWVRTMSFRMAVCTTFFVTFRTALHPKMHEFWAILDRHVRLCRHLCETEAVQTPSGALWRKTMLNLVAFFCCIGCPRFFNSSMFCFYCIKDTINA